MSTSRVRLLTALTAALLVVAVLAPAARAEEAWEDAAISAEKLDVLLKPLTKEDLEAAAATWQGLVRSSTSC